MTDSLYKHFTISSPAIFRQVLAFVKANAQAFIDRGTPLRLTITDEEQDRLDEQIAYYFGVVVRSISEQAWINGQRFGKEAWHEHLARKFLPEKEVALPSGEIALVRQSIARGKIGVRSMAKFTEEVTAYAITELGILIE